MKKLNKFILGAASVAAVAAPIAAAVSCGANSNWSKVPAGKYVEGGNGEANDFKSLHQVKTGEVVSFITDGGSITDKSFNEGTLDGVKAWSDGGDASKTFNVYQTANEGRNDSDFTTQYDAASKSNPNSIFVVAGFNHKIQKWLNDGPKTQKVVAIDIEDNDDANSLYGVTFKTQQSGFLAAVEVGFQLNEEFKMEKSSEAFKVATFGGQKITPVIAYMNGFAKGVEYFNSIKGELRALELTHAGGSASNDFSNSFSAGKGTAIANTLLNQGVRAILPVAGVETADVVEAIKAKKLQGKAFVIGVDVDQTNTFGGVVIGSAIKGLQAATLDMLTNLTSSTTAKDVMYSLIDNKPDKQFVGYIANKNYPATGYDAKRAEAEQAAEAADAFANHLLW